MRLAGVALFVDAVAHARPSLTAAELAELRALLEARALARCA